MQTGKEMQCWTGEESSVEGDPQTVQMLELEDKDFKITGKSMLKKVAKKVDNMCDGEFQHGN